MNKSQLSKLPIGDLQSRLEQAKKGAEALKAAGMAVPEVLTQEAELITDILAKREAEVVLEKIAGGLEAAVAKTIKNLEIDHDVAIAVVISPNEDGAPTVTCKASKKRSFGGGSGKKKNGKGKVFIVNGVEYKSGSEALQALKDAGTVAPETGASDSAPRTLKRLASQGAIELEVKEVQKEEPKAEEVSNEVAEASPAK